MATSGEQDMQFDSEGDQNSVDSFEKQLQQQEQEMQNQLREEEQQEILKAAHAAGDASSNMLPETAPDAAWKDESEKMDDMSNGDCKENSQDVSGSESGSTRKRNSPSHASSDKEMGSPPSKKGKQDEFGKLWSAVNSSPKDFQAWTNLLQHVDQQSDLEGGREAYTAFFARYPYCYGYWKKFADLEKRKGSKETTLKVFEKGLQAIPLSVDLWVHYADYITLTFTEETDERFVRQEFERAVQSCGLEFRSDKIWDAFINWETNHKRWHRVTAVYDKLLATPVAKYVQHWAKFQEHAKKHPVTEVISLDEFLANRRSIAKSASEEDNADGAAETTDEAPPGVEEDAANKEGGSMDTPASAGVALANEEEGKKMQEMILAIREKLHQATTEEVKLRWNFEDAIKRPYFHVKPLERSQLQAWREYLEFEVKQGNEMRTRILFERCLIAAALYEEFWLRYIHYLETLKSVTQTEMDNVYERACTIHLKDKIKPHLSWAIFQEESKNTEKALDILKEIQERLPEAVEPWLQRAAVERRRGQLEKAECVFTSALEHFKPKSILTLPYANILIKYSRFLSVVKKESSKSMDILESVVKEKVDGGLAVTADEQRSLDMILWSLLERCIASSDTVKALEVFKMGLSEIFAPHSRLAFARRRHQFILDFGTSENSLIEAGRELRDIQNLLKQMSQEDMGGEKHGGPGSGDTPDSKKDRKARNERPPPSQHQNPPPSHGQQNGGYYGGGQNYGGQGGSGYQQYPPSSGSGGSNSSTHQQPPPQHPPPPQGGQQNYGGYNQNYQQQGGYPPQQYQGGWGYPPQHQGNYNYNQQQWSGYNNYYGQR